MRRRILPIHWRFTVGFIVIFSISTGCLYVYITHVLNEQTNITIRADMQKLQSFVYDHIQQDALVHQGSKESEQELISRLLYGISRSTGHPAAYYDKSGRFAGGTRFTKGGSVILDPLQSASGNFSLEADIALSAQNKSVVTRVRDGDEYLAMLTIPYYSGEHYEGSFRLTSDYSGRYMHNHAILKSLAGFAAFLFVIVTVFTYILSRRMTRPLIALSHAMRGLGEGIQEDAALPVNRSDEVGQLAASFKQMKRQIEEQMEHLEAERNRVVALEKSKRRFYQHITHELKTPLTSISGYAQIIGKPNFSDPVFLERAAVKIKTESDRLHNMVAQVLELARREDEGQRQAANAPVDLHEQLQACCDDLEVKAARYNMLLKCDSQLLTVSGNSEELRKVWVNLMDNAIKYGVAGTDIQIKAYRSSEFAIVQVVNERDTDRDADELLVFEPFYRSHGAGLSDSGSIGLGLAICRAIVESHGGTIVYRQEDGHVIVEARLPLWT